MGGEGPLDPGRVIGKVTRRLIPFLFLLYVVAFLDRVNVGFAALQMKADLGFSDAVYGLGAIGLSLRGHPAGRRPWFSLPAFFVLVNVASLHAAWNLLTGRRIDRWQPARAAEASAERAPVTGGTDR